MFIRKRITSVVFAIALVAFGHQCFAQRWLSMDKGLACAPSSSSVYEIFIDEANNKLYASGAIFENGYCEEWRMPALWNGQQWVKVGDWLSSIYFVTIGSFRDTLYSSNSYYGDEFSNLLKWTGASWDTIPGGPLSSGMYSMLEHKGYLYVSGAINQCAGDSANLVFRYDGKTVEPLVDFFESPSWGLAIAFYHDTLFVGGSFDDYDRDIHTLTSVYDFDIHTVGQGLGSNSIIEAMEIHDGVLWLGGYFGPGNFDSEEYYYLAYYDGYTIKPSPWQPDGRVVALKSYNNELYMAGWFAHIEDLESHCVAKINDYGYYSLNPDTVYSQYGYAASYQAGIVRDMEIWNDTLYLAGAFGHIGTDTALNCIAKLNRSLTQIPQNIASDVSLFPNPTQEELTLQSNNFFNQNADIRIYDSTGRLIQTTLWPLAERRKQLQVHQLANSVYTITIETTSGTIVKKFVKQ